MEIIIQKEELIKINNILERALPKKTVIESLKGIKIKAEKNVVTFSASKTDLAIEYICEENFQIIQEGTVIIPGSQFITIVKKTNEEDITISSDNQNSTLLKTTKSKINLLSYDNTSYPILKFDTNELSHLILDTKTLITCYNHTKHAIAINAIKPILTGINFDIFEQTIKVGATDARRLAISTITKEKTFNPNNVQVNFTIPRYLLSDITKILEAAELNEFELFVANNQITIKTNNLKIKTRLLEGEYPVIERLIPQKKTYSFIINSSELLRILEKIILLSDRDSSNLTTQVKNDVLLLQSFFREIGGIEELCTIEEIHGTPFEISYDPRFLMDAIHAIGETKLEMNFVDEISAFSITDTKERNNIQVISPIKLS